MAGKPQPAPSVTVVVALLQDAHLNHENVYVLTAIFLLAMVLVGPY